MPPETARTSIRKSGSGGGTGVDAPDRISFEKCRPSPACKPTSASPDMSAPRAITCRCQNDDRATARLPRRFDVGARRLQLRPRPILRSHCRPRPEHTAIPFERSAEASGRQRPHSVASCTYSPRPAAILATCATRMSRWASSTDRSNSFERCRGGPRLALSSRPGYGRCSVRRWSRSNTWVRHRFPDCSASRSSTSSPASSPTRTFRRSSTP